MAMCMCPAGMASVSVQQGNLVPGADLPEPALPDHEDPLPAAEAEALDQVPGHGGRLRGHAGVWTCTLSTPQSETRRGSRTLLHLYVFYKVHC